MVGLGETFDEVVATLADLAAVGVRTATVGPVPPADLVAPARRALLDARGVRRGRRGRARLGLAHVQASPLTRSSYHARDAHAASVPVALRAGR